jgi:osmotically-inducible protein OsmY
MRPVLHVALIFILSMAFAFAQSDVEIQTAVQKAIPETTIHASVQNGAVILTGFVDLYRDRLLADETVSRIYGVKIIRDRIIVAGPQVPDAQLKSEIDEIIADRIRSLGTFGSGTITAQVQDGAVTLSGKATRQLTESAIDTIAGTVGVKNVINHVHLVAPYDKEPWRQFVSAWLGN